MSDPIVCPECDGARGQQLGGLFLACQFCGGLGHVGGEHEPAELGQREPPPRRPAWEHPALIGTGLCGHCLNSRRVVHVEGGHLMQLPCPACTPAA